MAPVLRDAPPLVRRDASLVRGMVGNAVKGAYTAEKRGKGAFKSTIKKPSLHPPT